MSIRVGLMLIHTSLWLTSTTELNYSLLGCSSQCLSSRLSNPIFFTGNEQLAEDVIVM